MNNNYIKPKYYETREDGVKLYIFKSENNKVLLQVETGIEYDVAIDVESLPYTYIETDKEIGYEENSEQGK